ncbi:Flagellar basal body rod protein FlgB [Buchnera aphidicola (Tetraneura ulmi)]|uniref:flagellar basal body rod protein FlgB n=1 Tax=Buchnera aphidicola TaxID=9 RepID=UPI0034645390
MFSGIQNFLQMSETALTIRALRQELLATNIANSETPNYKAKDIDFYKTMKSLIKNRKKNLNFLKLTKKSNKNFYRNLIPYIKIHTISKNRNQSNNNVNTVNMNKERTKFADNSIQYQVLLTILNSQIKDMYTVTQG